MHTQSKTQRYFGAAQNLDSQNESERHAAIADILNLGVHDDSAVGRHARAVMLERFGAVVFPASRENDPPPSGDLEGTPTEPHGDNVVSLKLPRAG